MKKITTLGMTLLAASCGFADTIEIKSECAGMSGFRKFWDTPVVVAEDGARKQVDPEVKDWGQAVVWGGENPGPLAFDAVHRSLLVRFPGAAEAIAAKLKEGYAIEKVEIALTHTDDELWNDSNVEDGNYNWYMANNRDKQYREKRPNWHALAAPLRKPWKADAEFGPTFNAAVNGAVYWTRWGATDTKEDRFDMTFGPTEVSSYNPNGRMDITAFLTSEDFGATLGERLRLLSDCGFALTKWETYDHRYFEIHYEYTTATGGRAIVIKEPVLSVTFSKADRPEAVALAPAADIAAMVGKAKAEGKPQGAPTAFLPSWEEVKALDAKFMAKPAWMPEWQYQHVMDLVTRKKDTGRIPPFYYQLLGALHYTGIVTNRLLAAKPDATQDEIDYAVYKLWVDYTLCNPPRFWEGFTMPEDSINLWVQYRAAMPGPAQDHFLKCWNAWLMPDRESVFDTPQETWNFEDLSGKLVHPQADWSNVGRSLDGQRQASWGHYYYENTGDWRGNRSFYRGSYARYMSTEGFNYCAVSGALLLGQVTGAERAIADGRYGLVKLPFWLWTYGGGLAQTYGDHYYWAVPLLSNKLFPDYCERHEDKMLGWSMLQKNIEDLVGAYHPGLRKTIGPASRTFSHNIIGQMEGTHYILHVLSKKGALTDTAGTLPLISKNPDAPTTAWGTVAPPLNVARQSLVAPWADEWITDLVDEKPLPWTMYAQKEGCWVGTYFGENYGFATMSYNASSYTGSQRLHLTGYWRRKEAQPETMADTGTMEMRVGFNDQTPFVDDYAVLPQRFGEYQVYQYQNKAILLARPDMKVIQNSANGGDAANFIAYPTQDVCAVQCTAAFFNFEQPKPTWEIYVDKQKVELPATAKFGQVITIKDGVSYMAIRPLDGGTVGRDVEVTLVQGEIEPPQEQSRGNKARAELKVNAYFARKDAALSEEDVEKVAAMRGGFVFEMGDVKDYGSFEQFQKAMLAATCDVTPSANGITVRYTNGADTLLAQWMPTPNPEEGFTVNGKTPYPSRELWRDSTLSQMGRAARFEKNGAVIECKTNGPIMLLQTLPQRNLYIAMNPTPTYHEYTFTTPDGVKIEADGMLSMGRWVVKGTSELEIKYCEFEDEFAFHVNDPVKVPPKEKRAKNLLVTGMKDKPKVTLNGVDVTETMEKESNGWRIAL